MARWYLLVGKENVKGSSKGSTARVTESFRILVFWVFWFLKRCGSKEWKQSSVFELGEVEEILSFFEVLPEINLQSFISFNEGREHIWQTFSFKSWVTVACFSFFFPFCVMNFKSNNYSLSLAIYTFSYTVWDKACKCFV